MENSIEKDEEILNNIKAYMQENIDKGYHKFVYNDLGYDEKCADVINAIEHILSDYKRVLKENEELKKELNEENKRCMMLAEEKQDYFEKYRYHLQQNKSLTKEFSNVIPIQKIKDIIDRIDYDIKKTKEIISNNSNIYTSDRRNDYQIVRLRAMNTKSLDIKKRLQELLESEE